MSKKACSACIAVIIALLACAPLSGAVFTGPAPVCGPGDAGIFPTHGAEPAANGSASPRLAIFPGVSLVIYKGSTQHFDALLADGDGNEISGATFQWRVSDMSLGKITASGLFAAGNSTGTVTVNVSCYYHWANYANSSVVTIKSARPQMTGVEIIPNRLDLKKGEAKPVAVRALSGTDSLGGANYTWSGGSGLIDALATGNTQFCRFRGMRAGTGSLDVRAACTDAAGKEYNMTASLDFLVIWGAHRIVVTAASHELVPGERMEFNATAYDVAADGSDVVIDGAMFDWTLQSLNPAGFCSIDTAYGTSTNLTASQYGWGIVAAGADSITGHADFTVPIPDDSPPAISHEPVKNSPPKQAILIRADVYDSSEIGYVYLHVRAADNKWKTIQMKPVAGDLTGYSANISAGIVTAPGIDYYIESRDVYGNTAYSPTGGASHPYHVAVEQPQSFFSTPEFWLAAVSLSLLAAVVASVLVLRKLRRGPARASPGIGKQDRKTNEPAGKKQELLEKPAGKKSADTKKAGRKGKEKTTAGKSRL